MIRQSIQSPFASVIAVLVSAMPTVFTLLANDHRTEFYFVTLAALILFYVWRKFAQHDMHIERLILKCESQQNSIINLMSDLAECNAMRNVKPAGQMVYNQIASCYEYKRVAA